MRGEGLVWWWVSSNPGPQLAGSDEQNGYWRTISNKSLEKGGGFHLTELKLSVFPFLCVSNSTFRPGDPQSAQDKARMDKEYLSLMAELGEAPVPASVGSTSGPATTPLASAPRPAAPASNPPPPVSPGTILWSSSRILFCRETRSYG